MFFKIRDEDLPNAQCEQKMVLLGFKDGVGYYMTDEDLRYPYEKIKESEIPLDTLNIIDSDNTQMRALRFNPKMRSFKMQRGIIPQEEK